MIADDRTLLFSHLQESSYGAAIPVASINNAVSLEALSVSANPTGHLSDAATITPPPGIPSTAITNLWQSRINLSTLADPDLTALLLYLALGKITSTPLGGGRYLHTIAPAAPSSLEWQLPSTTLNQLYGSSYHSYPGAIPANVQLSGGHSQLLQLSAELTGNGQELTTAAPTFTPRAPRRLRDSTATLLLGPPAAQTSIACRILDWSLKINNTFRSGNEVAIDQVAPLDPANPERGQIRAANELKTRTITATLKIQYNDDVPRTQLRNLVAQQLTITIAGDDGDLLTIDAPKLIISNAVHYAEDRIVVIDLDTLILTTDPSLGGADAISIAINNTTPSYNGTPP